MTTPVPYQSNLPGQSDLSHLRTLSICYYVWGGLAMLGSCVMIIYLVLGIVVLANPAAFNSPNSAPEAPPAWLGWFFIAMGGCGLLAGWAMGGLSIYSGRCIARQRNRTFSLVMAALNCLSIPLGTILGVFTFIILSRPTVKALYAANAPPRP